MSLVRLFFLAGYALITLAFAVCGFALVWFALLEIWHALGPAAEFRDVLNRAIFTPKINSPCAKFCPRSEAKRVNDFDQRYPNVLKHARRT